MAHFLLDLCPQIPLPIPLICWHTPAILTTIPGSLYLFDFKIRCFVFVLLQLLIALFHLAHHRL